MTCTRGNSYRIKSGDTLYIIAQSQLGDGSRWREIMKPDGTLFTEAEADNLQVDQEICLPSGSSDYVLVHQSQYWDWYATSARWNANSQVYLAQSDFPDQVYETLKEFLGIDPIQQTSDKRLYLLVNEKTGGGFAGGFISEIGKGPGIGISWDAWTSQFAGNTYWSHELIAHETVNLFTGWVVSGWPVDWWANHRSPFPFMVKINTLEALGYTDGAQADRNRADILTKMFLDLQTQYNWDIYRQLLKYLADDGWKTWDTLMESGGTNPSVLRSSYVAAYLSLAAKKNLTDVLNRAFSETNLGYTLDAQVVEQIIDRRNQLQTLPRDSTQWNDFRKGITPVLNKVVIYEHANYQGASQELA